MQGGNQAKVVEHVRPQFAGKAMHRIDGIFHQFLSASKLGLELFSSTDTALAEGGQLDVDPDQGLHHFVVQLPTDPLPLLFLHRDNLMR